MQAIANIRKEKGEIDDRDIFIPRGVTVPSLSRNKQWEFTPCQGMVEGAKIAGGDIYATLPETVVMKHKLMCEPDHSGMIKYIAAAGNYTLEDTVLSVEKPDGSVHDMTMMQVSPTPVNPFYPVHEIACPFCPVHRISQPKTDMFEIF